MTKLVIIAPPIAAAVKKRSTRNPSNQGINAHAAPNTTCIMQAITRGCLRPNLKKKKFIINPFGKQKSWGRSRKIIETIKNEIRDKNKKSKKFLTL